MASASPTVRRRNRLFIALVVLTLLCEAAEDRLLICVADDEQWLVRGSAQVLMFVARRLKNESGGLIFAARGGHPLPRPDRRRDAGSPRVAGAVTPSQPAESPRATPRASHPTVWEATDGIDLGAAGRA